MEDFVARPDMIAPRRLRALSQKTDMPGLVRLAQHLGALCLTGAAVLYAAGSFWIWPAMFVHGILLVFLFCPLHEAAHGTAFKSRWLNARTGDLCGFLTVYPRLMYRSAHFAHHRYTQDPDRDPELGLKKPTTFWEYLLWISGWHYWTTKIGMQLRIAVTGRVSAPFIQKKSEKGIVRESRLLIGGYAAIAVAGALTDPLVPLCLWVIPALLGQPVLRMYLLSEHTGCAGGPNMLENVRTVLAGPLVRWLAWNMPYHTEHHTFPSIPFHALPAAHAEIKDRLVHVAPSHAAYNADLLRQIGPRETLSRS